MNKEQLKAQLISEMLLLPITAVDYHTSEHLRSIYPEKALVEGEMGMFNVEAYAKADLCTLTPKTFLYNQMTIYWQGPEPAMMHAHHIRRMRGGMMGMDPFNRFTRTFREEDELSQGAEKRDCDTKHAGEANQSLRVRTSFF